MKLAPRGPTARPRAFLALAFLALLALAGCEKQEREGQVGVTIAAASSLRHVTPALIEAFERSHPRVKIRASYGASGDLRKRVQDGAPYDAVMMANAKPVDALIASGHVTRDSRRVIAGNDLILIAPSDSDWGHLTFETIDELPAGEKLAIGEPAAVPAGQYARHALKRLDKWQGLQGRLVVAGQVAAVLAYARRGEVAAAIVYETDVRGIDDVVILDRARGDWAPAPEVVVGVVAAGEASKQSDSFLDFVASDEGQKIFEEHGFRPTAGEG